MENLYKDIAGLDMTYEETRNLCREPYKDENNQLYLGRSKNIIEGEYEKFNANRADQLVECIREINFFPQNISYDIKTAFVFRLRQMKMNFSAKTIKKQEALKRFDEVKSYK